MFDLSVGKLMVLAIVAVLVVGPDRLPSLARDAARMIRSLREMATGAREQLRDELGPEFADVDLRNLNPRTVVQRAVFGDITIDEFNPGTGVRNAVFGDDDLSSADPRTAFREARDSMYDKSAEPVRFLKPAAASGDPAPRPRPRPAPGPRYDHDAT